MATVFGWDVWGNDWSTSAGTTSYQTYVNVNYSNSNDGWYESPAPASELSGPLAWLDEQVEEITGMGRELMEAA